MGLPLILIDQIPLNLLQQLELPSFNLVALAQLVGNPLQPIFKAIQATYIYGHFDFLFHKCDFGSSIDMRGYAPNIQSSTRGGKTYSLNGVNIEKGTRFPGALA